MKRFWLGVAAMAVMSACSGGNPFAPDDGTTPTPDPTIPTTIAGSVSGVSYDPVAQTLTITGVELDDTPFQAVYRRRAGMDVPGYEAYTVQDSSLDRHTTAFVRERDGTRAIIAVSGAQFNYYFGGSNYSRTGSFDPPTANATGGLVSYAGSYVGLLNGAGDGGDLLPVDPTTPADVRPNQAAEVTGSIFINADFADNAVNGVIYNRNVVDRATPVENLDLAPTSIAADGTFTGNVTQQTATSLNDRGDYGGIFGGTDASAVAGTLFVSDHITAFNGEEEYGLFVLAQCGTPGADPVCNQPVP